MTTAAAVPISAAPVTVHTLEFTGRRITLAGDAAFPDVIRRLDAAFPPIDLAHMDELVARGDASALRAYLNAVAPGPSFNRFHALDQGGAMSLLGTPLRSRYYLVGNVLIAQDLFTRERASGLCAPVRVVVTESTTGGTAIDYDEPTSIFGQFPALQASPVPAMLDAKLRERFVAALAA